MKIEPFQPLTPSPRTAPVEALKPVQERQVSRFDALLSKREIRARQSLRGDVEKLSDSADINAELFGNSRSLDLLDHLLRHVLPTMDTDPQTRQLAEDLLREEVQMRGAVEQQRSEAQG